MSCPGNQSAETSLLNMAHNTETEQEPRLYRFTRAASAVLTHFLCFLLTGFIAVLSRPGTSEFSSVFEIFKSLSRNNFFSVLFHQYMFFLGLFSWHPFFMTLAVSWNFQNSLSAVNTRQLNPLFVASSCSNRRFPRQQVQVGLYGNRFKLVERG